MIFSQSVWKGIIIQFKLQSCKLWEDIKFNQFSELMKKCCPGPVKYSQTSFDSRSALPSSKISVQSKTKDTSKGERLARSTYPLKQLILFYSSYPWKYTSSFSQCQQSDFLNQCNLHNISDLAIAQSVLGSVLISISNVSSSSLKIMFFTSIALIELGSII